MNFNRDPIIDTFIISSLSGSVGGIAQLLISQPLDIIKMRMQSEVNNRIFKNSWHCARSLILTEGLSAFYKGTTAPFTGVALSSAAQFGVNEICKKLLPEKLGKKKYWISGGIAGFAS